MYRRLTAAAVLLLALPVAGPALLHDSLSAQQKKLTGYEKGQPYSEAVTVGNTIYFSGKLGLSSDVRNMPVGSERMKAEVKNILEAYKANFQEMGIGFDDVVQATVFVKDLKYYNDLNEVWSQYFTDSAPARAAVGVSDIVAGGMVEIAMTAVK